MAEMESMSVKEALALACLASVCSIVGALATMLISQAGPPHVSRAWLYAMLKSFFAGAVTIATVVDSTYSPCPDNTIEWESIVGGSLTAGFAAAAVGRNPREEHEHDAVLKQESCGDLQGGVLTAAVIGVRNLAYGAWFFSAENLGGRIALQVYGRALLGFLAPQFGMLGAAVAVPMYFGGGKWRALLAVVASAGAFPVGLALAPPSGRVACLALQLAGYRVSGMIQALTIMYLFPSSLQHAPSRHCWVACAFGAACMAGMR